MEMLPAPKGGKGFSTTTKVILFGLGLFALYQFIDPLINAAIALIDRLSSGLERLALPAAIAAVVLGFLLLISPWHRRHGREMVMAGVLAAFGAGLAVKALTWVHSGNTSGGAGLTMNGVVTIAQFVGAVFKGIQAGVGAGIHG
jgi:hypothetical protein